VLEEREEHPRALIKEFPDFAVEHFVRRSIPKEFAEGGIHDSDSVILKDTDAVRRMLKERVIVSFLITPWKKEELVHEGTRSSTSQSGLCGRRLLVNATQADEMQTLREAVCTETDPNGRTTVPHHAHFSIERFVVRQSCTKCSGRCRSLNREKHVESRVKDG
jgi:hypothetical protein